MSLYQTSPDFITISGAEYPIDTDFRRWVQFQGILLSDKSDEEKASEICHMMDSMGLPNTVESLESMLRFYEAASTENETGSGGNVQAYDLEKDSEYIFSAFLDSYGIDLEKEHLHWWIFKALFKSLPEDCKICRIMMYRTIDIKKVPKDQRKYYQEMKRRYSLKNCWSEYRTKEQIIEYHKRRRAEAKSSMPEMRGGK